MCIGWLVAVLGTLRELKVVVYGSCVNLIFGDYSWNQFRAFTDLFFCNYHEYSPKKIKFVRHLSDLYAI
uniref:Putative secreted protein n=1 Tax=Panstrongylus lignarius TaxID=156445 RepID=A0A224Y702_9HEMI